MIVTCPQCNRPREVKGGYSSVCHKCLREDAAWALFALAVKAFCAGFGFLFGLLSCRLLADLISGK